MKIIKENKTIQLDEFETMIFYKLLNPSPNDMRKNGLTEEEIKHTQTLNDGLLSHYYSIHGNKLADFFISKFCNNRNIPKDKMHNCGNCKYIAEKSEHDTSDFTLCQRFEHDYITEDEAYVDSGDWAASSGDLYVRDTFYCKYFERKL